MKKLFLVALVLLSSLSSVLAQQWEVRKTEADELKGTPASSSHLIEIANHGAVVLDDNADMFGFFTFDGIFDYKRNSYDFLVAKGIFGMYDEAGKLVGKEEIELSVQEDNPKSALADSRITLLRNSGIRKVAAWIRSNKGSVRIVIPRYGDLDFDVTVPTYLSQKGNKSTQAKPKGNMQRGRTSQPARSTVKR